MTPSKFKSTNMFHRNPKSEHHLVQVGLNEQWKHKYHHDSQQQIVILYMTKIYIQILSEQKLKRYEQREIH